MIDLKFTEIGSGENGPLKPVATFKFEISDIDWSKGGGDCFQTTSQGWRRDQVVITAGNGASPVTAFTLKPLVTAIPPRTFLIDPVNVATAIGTGAGRPDLESNSDDNGTVVVDFGPTYVTDVRITYNEAGYDLNNNNNPGYRGIGILGGTTSLPVELMEFTLE